MARIELAVDDVLNLINVFDRIEVSNDLAGSALKLAMKREVESTASKLAHDFTIEQVLREMLRRQKQAVLEAQEVAQPSTTGALLISEERRKQRDTWTDDRDDDHPNGELVMAAVCYALLGLRNCQHLDDSTFDAFFKRLWPFDENLKLERSSADALIAAGALIAAELDRRGRLTPGAVV